MKQLFNALILIFASSTMKANVLLVNNSSGANALYTTINAGMAAANPGDTLYVSGSNVTYASFTITKSIVIIGQGSFSQKQNGYSTKVNGFNCNSNISNIKVKGLNLINSANFDTKANLSQIEISGNYFSASAGVVSFNGSSNCSFLNISNNVFGTVGLYRIDFVNSTGINNVLIQNNLIFGSIRSINAVNALFSNNVFLNISQAFEFFGASPFENAIIKDNIFYNADPIANTSNCTYSNNMSFSTTLTYSAMPGFGNFDNVNPEFVNVIAGSYTSAFNFHLGAASPAIGVSSIGNDIGFYGGTLHADVSGETENVPVIRLMDIQNVNLAPNGNVNVKVRSTKAR